MSRQRPALLASSAWRNIVGKFLISTRYLPGAQRESCPYARILELAPPWAETRRQ